MIGIIDYGAGNIKSVVNALNDIKTDYLVTNSFAVLDKCEKIIMPGVGEAGYAMSNLDKYNLTGYIKSTEKPFLGICLGMQLLTKKSEEGNTICLGITEGETLIFNKTKMIVPHMGWNNVYFDESEKLFTGIKSGTSFYFANSFYVKYDNYSIAYSEYDIKFSTAIRNKNFYGIQFHPEKSGQNGIKLLENFIKLC